MIRSVMVFAATSATCAFLIFMVEYVYYIEIKGNEFNGAAGVALLFFIVPSMIFLGLFYCLFLLLCMSGVKEMELQGMAAIRFLGSGHFVLNTLYSLAYYQMYSSGGSWFGIRMTLERCTVPLLTGAIVQLLDWHKRRNALDGRG